MLKSIPTENYTINSFVVNKSYNFNYNTSGSAEDNPNGIFIYVGDNASIYNKFYGPSVFVDLNSNLEPTNPNGLKSIGVYDTLNHMFYDSTKSRYDLFGGFDSIRQNLTDVVYVISVSEAVYGERIEPSTVTITDKTFTVWSTASNAYVPMVFQDDGQGNLYEQTSLNQVGNVFYEMGLIVFNRISNMTDVSASLALTNTWATISSGSQHIPSGVYIVRIQTTSGGTVNQQYSGLMNWYTGNGTANVTSSVTLQAGESTVSSSSDTVYLQVQNVNSSPSNLQISTFGSSSMKEYQLRFYRVF